MPPKILVVLAGIGQIALVLGTTNLPRALGWRQDLAKLRPLNRQIFWTYAFYIAGTNLSFGLLSALAPGWLLDGSPLAGAVAGYITLYWGARVAIQFFYFDRSSAPQGKIYLLAEVALVSLFVALTLLYGAIAFKTLVR